MTSRAFVLVSAATLVLVGGARLALAATGTAEPNAKAKPSPTPPNAKPKAKPSPAPPKVAPGPRRRVRPGGKTPPGTPTPPPDDPPPPDTPPHQAETGPLAGLTAAHNQARAAVGVSAVVWSDALAGYAQQWADHLAQENGCNLQHRVGDSYGENLFWTTVPRDADYVVGSWTSEKPHYDPATGTCASGQVCGHYTQVVWADTTTIGCGVATCDGKQVWVCNYDPQGNFLGQKAY